MDNYEEDQYQESIVTASDGRIEPQSKDIYACIGQLVAKFEISNQWSGTKKSTGTVIFVKNSTAYILTCAHAVRCSIFRCLKCKHYRSKKKACCQEKWNGPNQQQKILKPTSIKWIGTHAKTDAKEYKCNEYYVPINYMTNSEPKDGYDWAFLRFTDSNNIYQKRTAEIKISLMDGRAVFTNKFAKPEYAIFGYPHDKDNKLVGMKSNNTNQFKIEHNQLTNQHYLYQIGIDTMSGQSGALIWYKQDQQTVICGIHVGGSNGTKKNPQPYNIGTLIGPEIIKKWKAINVANPCQAQIIVNDNVESDEEILSQIPPSKIIHHHLNPQYNFLPTQPSTPLSTPPPPTMPTNAYICHSQRREQYRQASVDAIKAQFKGKNSKKGDLKIRINNVVNLSHKCNFASISIADTIFKTIKLSSNKNQIFTFRDYRAHIGKTALLSVGYKNWGEKVIGVAEFELPIAFNREEKLKIDVRDANNKVSGMIMLEQCIVYK